MYTTTSSVSFLERITYKLYHYSQMKSLKCLNNHKFECPSQGMCPTPGESTLIHPDNQGPIHGQGFRSFGVLNGS